MAVTLGRLPTPSPDAMGRAMTRAKEAFIPSTLSTALGALINVEEQGRARAQEDLKNRIEEEKLRISQADLKIREAQARTEDERLKILKEEAPFDREMRKGALAVNRQNANTNQKNADYQIGVHKEQLAEKEAKATTTAIVDQLSSVYERGVATADEVDLVLDLSEKARTSQRLSQTQLDKLDLVEKEARVYELFDSASSGDVDSVRMLERSMAEGGGVYYGKIFNALTKAPETTARFLSLASNMVARYAPVGGGNPSSVLYSQWSQVQKQIQEKIAGEVKGGDEIVDNIKDVENRQNTAGDLGITSDKMGVIPFNSSSQDLPTVGGTELTPEFRDEIRKSLVVPIPKDQVKVTKDGTDMLRNLRVIPKEERTKY